MGQLLFQIFIGLIFLLFWLVGMKITFQSYKGLRAGISSRKWNPVEAVVTDHKVYTYTTGGQASRTAYGYSVMYTYSVEHQTYQGSGFDCGNFVKWEDAERASVEDYPVDKAVDIFYNPDKPEISSSRTLLERIVPEVIWLCMGVGWTSVFTGMIVLFANRADAKGSVAMPFLQMGTSIILIVFWCVMLSIILSTLINCFKEIKNRRLPRPGWGILIVLFLFGVFSTHLIGGLVQLLGVILIGSAPAEGCYQPNFQEKRWTLISCPPPSNGQN
jgi:Protein of unknown function (DUF3592)